MNENQEIRVQKVPRRSRRSREEIERLANEYKTSGMNQGEFCRMQGWDPKSLRRQLKRGGEGPETAQPAGRLIAVSLKREIPQRATSGLWTLEVVLSSGRRIGVGADFEAETLERLLNVLERT